jgi:outer membrane lipoprotein carrier protein
MMSRLASTRRVLLLGFLCTAAQWTASAQELTARQVFDNFQKVYARTKTVSAEFEETTIIDGQKRTAKGSLRFQKPNLLRQEYLDPKEPKTVAQLIVLDGKTSWSYTPWMNQVTRKETDPKTGRELLPGAGEELENVPKNYSLRLKDDPAARAKAYLLVIEPKPDAGARAGDESLEVWIRKTDWIPMQFAYTHKPNDVVTIVALANVRRNVPVSASDFVFTPPAGADVVTITDDYKSDR